MADDASPPPMPLAQWRIVAAVFAVLTLGLAAWYFFALRDDYTILYRDLRPSDASAITANLARGGIRYRSADSGRQILVPASQTEMARTAVDAAGAGGRGIEGFELFDQSDMGLNDFAERIRYQRAIQGELERTIMMMDGVVTARVHISMPDRTPFRGEQQVAGAAVTFVTRTPEDQTPARVEGIQRLVAASVSGLTAADVVVLSGRGEVLSPRVEITNISGALLGGDGSERRTAIDLITQVMRQALPDRRFEVSIEQAEMPVAQPAASANPPPARAADTPIFTRIVKLATEIALTDAEKQRVRTLLRNAGLVDGSLEQTVLFSVGLSSDALDRRNVASNGGTSIATPNRPISAPDANAGTLMTWLFAALLVVTLAGGLAFVAWRNRNRPVLSAEEQLQFAERLRSALKTQAEGGPA